MKCPKCGFEQLDASAQECAKCGILFAKWRSREQERKEAGEALRDFARLEESSVPAQLGLRQPQLGVQQSQLVFEQPSSGMAPVLGTVFIRFGGLMCGLGILSFGLNLIGLEFVLLMPLEAFDEPTAAKLCTIGGGFALAMLGGILGGEVEDDD